MFYKELGLILLIVILLALIFFGRLSKAAPAAAARPTGPEAATAPTAPTAPTVPDTAVGPIGPVNQRKLFDPKPVEAIKQPSDHSYPFPRMMDGYLDETMLQRPCTKDGDCISGNCGSYGYCAAQYKKLVPSSTFLYMDEMDNAVSFGSLLVK